MSNLKFPIKINSKEDIIQVMKSFKQSILDKSELNDNLKFVIELRRPSIDLIPPNGLDPYKVFLYVLNKLNGEEKEKMKQMVNSNPDVMRFYQQLKLILERINHSTCFRLSYSPKSNQFYLSIQIHERYSLQKYIKEKLHIVQKHYRPYTFEEVLAILLTNNPQYREEKVAIMKLLKLSNKKIERMLKGKYKKRKWIHCKVLRMNFIGKFRIEFMVRPRYALWILKTLKVYYYERKEDKSWLIRHDKLAFKLLEIDILK